MTIDEAIKHCEEVAEKLEDYVKSGCCCDDTEIEDEHLKCADEHRQLAEWLKELKAYRDMWDKVIRELHELIQGDNGVELVQVGEKRALEIIERYKKEIEE